MQSGFHGAQCPGERVNSKGPTACSAGRTAGSVGGVFSLQALWGIADSLCSCAVLLAKAALC